MTVHPVHLNGMIQNTQDVSAMRHQEETKPSVEQQNIQVQEEQKELKQAQQVNTKDNASQMKNEKDAKDKGSNEYRKQEKKNKKEQHERLSDGSVKLKMTMSGGFDIKI